MVQASRTSGLLGATASNLVFVGQCKLMSIHACENAGALAIVEIHDCAAVADIAASNMVSRLRINQGNSLEFDMHGVLMMKGICAVEASGDASFSVEFS